MASTSPCGSSVGGAGPAPSTPLGALEAAFVALGEPPRALSIDGAEVPGLPERPIRLGELRSRLLHPSTPFVTRDVALAVVLRRAQLEGGAWVIALAGLLGPGLGRIAGSVSRACPGKRADIEAEMLAGLVASIATADPERARLAARLTWAARREALAVVRAELAERARPAARPLSGAPPRPWGHPDLVLVQAVEHGVISSEDAELISATRLGDMTMRQAAMAWGATYQAIRSRRMRAEAQLVAWIRSGFGTDRPQRAGYGGAGGRPRQGQPPAAGRDAPTGPATKGGPSPWPGKPRRKVDPLTDRRNP